MKRAIPLVLAAVFTAVIPFTAHADTSPAAGSGLNCDVGPVQKTYGKTDWLVYSCHDDVTVAFITVADSPAAPFYFMFSPVKGH